ncbi:MAG: hypothetical protein JSU86_03195 [Phycisphaerales bacterium]|nr:MAG: hypothetical protein JSU86_03195 [Phycisphaerales bacterium]
MDATTRALIETNGATGYAMMAGADSDGHRVVEAADKETGERFVVRADDLYMAAVFKGWKLGMRQDQGKLPETTPTECYRFRLEA